MGLCTQCTGDRSVATLALFQPQVCQVIKFLVVRQLHQASVEEMYTSIPGRVGWLRLPIMGWQEPDLNF
jgi:hypothetical protein